MLQKGVYLYEYMDDWEKCNEKTLPERQDLCLHLNMEDTTDVDYTQTKKSLLRFSKKN